MRNRGNDEGDAVSWRIKGKEEGTQCSHWHEGRSLKRARFTLQTTTNSANSEAPSIPRCRLKTWPISSENKKDASLQEDERLHKRRQAR